MSNNGYRGGGRFPQDRWEGQGRRGFPNQSPPNVGQGRWDESYPKWTTATGHGDRLWDDPPQVGWHTQQSGMPNWQYNQPPVYNGNIMDIHEKEMNDNWQDKRLDYGGTVWPNNDDGWAGGDNGLLEKELSTLTQPRMQLPDERAQQRKERQRLDSSDGDSVETHDQFYRDHKLLLVLFRALAVMPITRSSPGLITFSWKSSAMAYAICFYILTTIIVLVVGHERVRILQTTKRFDDYIYAIIFVLFLVPHFWIPFVGWGVAPQVAIYKSEWGKFQLRYFRVTGESLQFPRLKVQIYLISGGCLVLAVLFLLSLSALMDGFYLWHTTAYYHIITMINMNCALWYINCKGIKVASHSLSECFKKEVKIACTSDMVSNYRFLWLNLSELLQALGNAYARTYSTYSLFMFMNITVAVYGGLSEIVDHGFSFSFKEFGLIVDTVYCTTLFFIFCDCSHKTTLIVAQGVQDTLLAIDMTSIDIPTQKEVDHFIQAIEMNPAIVSLRGYADVNRELLTSASTTIAVYLIVLLQFKISLPKDPQI